MGKDNQQVWDGFDASEFFSEIGSENLTETPPAALEKASVAEHRQILDILFLIDVSGSMRGQRIAQVNYALESIFKELRKRDELNSTIKIGIMEFAEKAEWITGQPVPLDDYVFTQISAQPWVTNYANAFNLLNDKLRREEFLDPRLGEYFAPLILFVTDGEPVDVTEYPDALAKLQKNGWFKKAAKYAIAVGEEARNESIGSLLSDFTGVRENVRYADEGEALCNLIEFIAIRASEVQTSMLSKSSSGKTEDQSLFDSPDASLFSSF